LNNLATVRIGATKVLKLKEKRLSKQLRSYTTEGPKFNNMSVWAIARSDYSKREKVKEENLMFA